MASLGEEINKLSKKNRTRLMIYLFVTLIVGMLIGYCICIIVLLLGG